MSHAVEQGEAYKEAAGFGIWEGETSEIILGSMGANKSEEVKKSRAVKNLGR